MTTSNREAQWATLMRAAIAGDTVAYQSVLISITPSLKVVVQRSLAQLGSLETEVELVVQEVLWAIHLKRRSWEATGEIGPWLSAITRYKLIQFVRKKGWSAEIPIEDVVAAIKFDQALDPTALETAPARRP